MINNFQLIVQLVRPLLFDQILNRLKQVFKGEASLFIVIGVLI